MLGLVHMIPILENIFRKDRKYILLRRVKGSRLCSLQARLKARGNNLQHNQKFTLQKINVLEKSSMNLHLNQPNNQEIYMTNK